MITHAEILRDGILGDLTPRQMESIRGIISGGRQLLNQVGEILTYARGAANQLTLVADAVRDARRARAGERAERVAAQEEAAGARRSRSTTSFRRSTADREKIAHVVGNLLGNAIDFTPSGRTRVAARARRRPWRRMPSLLVEVGDSGVGIAPEHHDLIFREFAQVDSTPSRPHHGTGLGLTIARKLVELHGGRIWVESELGTRQPVLLHGSAAAGGLTGAARWMLRRTCSSWKTMSSSAAHAHPVRERQPSRVGRGKRRRNARRRRARSAGSRLPRPDASRRRWARRSSSRCSRRAVDAIVVLTGHDDRETRQRCLAAGCAEVLVKPVPVARPAGEERDALAASRSRRYSRFLQRRRASTPAGRR